MHSVEPADKNLLPTQEKEKKKNLQTHLFCVGGKSGREENVNYFPFTTISFHKQYLVTAEKKKKKKTDKQKEWHKCHLLYHVI